MKATRAQGGLVEPRYVRCARNSRRSGSGAGYLARWMRCTSAARSRMSGWLTSIKKHDGSLSLIGVNTFLPKDHAGEIAAEIELIRSTEEEKGRRLLM